MTTNPDDDPVVRIADIAVAAVSRVRLSFAPAIRNEIAAAIRKEFSVANVCTPKAHCAQADDDSVVRIADIAVAAINRTLISFEPAIRSEIATVVRKEFSGDQVYIPKALAEQKAKRNEAMRTDRAAGLSIRAVARKHGVGHTRAGEILKGRR